MQTSNDHIKTRECEKKFVDIVDKYVDYKSPPEIVLQNKTAIANDVCKEFEIVHSKENTIYAPDIMNGENVIEVPEDMSVRRILHILLQNSVICACVYKIENDTKVYTGMINMSSAARFIIQCKVASVNVSVRRALGTFNYIKTDEDKMICIDDILEIMSRDNVYHIALYNDKVGVYSILSQRSLLRHLLLLSKLPTSLQDLCVSDLNIQDCIPIKQDITAKNALSILAHNTIHSAPIIDRDGKLCDVISVSDICILANNRMRKWVDNINVLLEQKVTDYIQKSRNYYFETKRATAPGQLVTCGIYTGVNDVIASLIHNNVHQVYIVDDNNKPLGIVNYSQIVSKIISCRQSTSSFSYIH